MFLSKIDCGRIEQNILEYSIVSYSHRTPASRLHTPSQGDLLGLWQLQKQAPRLCTWMTAEVPVGQTAEGQNPCTICSKELGPLR